MPHFAFEQEERLQKELIAMHLFISGGLGRSKIKFQKELFLLTRSLPKIGPLFDFIPYKFGPYSERAAAILENDSDIFSDIKSNIRLTSQGEEYGKEALSNMNDIEREQIIRTSKIIHSICNALTDEELMFLIYFTYGYEENSDVFGEMYEKREEIAEKLLSKNVITHQKYNEIVRGIV